MEEEPATAAPAGTGVAVLDRPRPQASTAGSTAANPNLPGRHQPTGGWTAFDAAGTPYDAYLSRPEGVAAAPGVLVIHHAGRFIRPYIKDVADGLAAAGYIAFAPDLLTPQGGADAFGNEMARITQALIDVAPDQHLAALHAALGVLRRQPGVGRTGVLGFCFGGGLAWRLVTEDADLAAATPFYGPNPPLDAVPAIRAAVLGVYAEDDDLINPGVPDLRVALEVAATTFEMRQYPGTRHGFHSHCNPERYVHEPARQAWADALAWFGRYLR
jgi:carboxymethylenebutenolidase